jgi:hypothetical protein
VVSDDDIAFTDDGRIQSMCRVDRRVCGGGNVLQRPILI